MVISPLPAQKYPQKIIKFRYKKFDPKNDFDFLIED